jgi:DNA-binding NarL/FixJ family response regulator
VRVVIADDAPLIREGIARLLAENGVEVVAQVDDAEALLRRVRELGPDLAVVDVRNRRRKPTRDFAPRARFARATPRLPFSSCRSTWSSNTRCG